MLITVVKVFKLQIKALSVTLTLIHFMSYIQAFPMFQKNRANCTKLKAIVLLVLRQNIYIAWLIGDI